VSYYPGEVARILKLKLDYHQLRRLFELLGASPDTNSRGGERGRGWSRYTFRDLVALRMAVKLARNERGHLDLRLLAKACATLRNEFGRLSPLTDTQLERAGDTIIARIGGRLFDARTGQRLIDGVITSVKLFVERECDETEADACLQQVKKQSRKLVALGVRERKGSDVLRWSR
jgi:hypothetical protein